MIQSGTITDSFGFIDTNISSADYVIIAVHMLTQSNQSVRVSNLHAGGNYRVQIIDATNGNVFTSGIYGNIYIWYIKRSIY